MSRWFGLVVLVVAASLPHGAADACSGPAPRSDELFYDASSDAFVALVAPGADVVRLEIGGAQELGAHRWASRSHTLLDGDGRLIVFREDYAEQGGSCTPRTLTVFTAGWGQQRGRRRMQVRAGFYVGPITRSPGGGRFAIRMVPELDELATRYVIVSVARRRVVGEIEGEQLGWIDDTHAVSISVDARTASVWTIGTRVETNGTLSTDEPSELRLVREAAGSTIVFERGSDGGSIRQPTVATDGSVNWTTQATAIVVPPDLVSLQGGRALYFDERRTRSVVRRLDTARITHRFWGRAFYGAAAFSPDGQRVAFIGHSEYELEEDGDSRADGYPSVEVFRLTDNARRHWGDNPRTVMYGASRTTELVAPEGSDE